MTSMKETIVEWFKQGYSRDYICHKTGLSMEFIDECLRAAVISGGENDEDDSSGGGMKL